MDKLTALKAIEEATAYLKSLETPETPETPADMPKDGESYYWIGHNGVEYPAIWNIANKTDYDRWLYGNCYLTLDAAEKTVAKQKATMRVLRKLRELDGDFVVDWNNNYQDKYCVYFDYSSNEFLFGAFSAVLYVSTEWYSTRKSYKYVIENMESDLKIMYGIVR